ncbi:hypothetical protein D918_08016 [Trichuris suis]|nr:hypothetical protein D918_08016 [Trichuris suis]
MYGAPVQPTETRNVPLTHPAPHVAFARQPYRPELMSDCHQAILILLLALLLIHLTGPVNCRQFSKRISAPTYDETRSRKCIPLLRDTFELNIPRWLCYAL